MKGILVSIKPQFVKEIKKGNKLFEFRRSIHKDKNIKKMLIYSSFLEQRIVALCDIEKKQICLIKYGFKQNICKE